MGKENLEKLEQMLDSHNKIPLASKQPEGFLIISNNFSQSNEHFGKEL